MKIDYKPIERQQTISIPSEILGKKDEGESFPYFKGSLQQC